MILEKCKFNGERYGRWHRYTDGDDGRDFSHGNDSNDDHHGNLCVHVIYARACVLGAPNYQRFDLRRFCAHKNFGPSRSARRSWIVGETKRFVFVIIVARRFHEVVRVSRVCLCVRYPAAVPDPGFYFLGWGNLKNVFPWDIFYNIAVGDW
jgi:hypothetical protein